MIYEEKLSNLLLLWKWRKENYHWPTEKKYNAGYRDALDECIRELEELIDHNDDQEALEHLLPVEVEQYLAEQAADDYNASIEAHEHVA